MISIGAILSLFSGRKWIAYAAAAAAVMSMMGWLYVGREHARRQTAEMAFEVSQKDATIAGLESKIGAQSTIIQQLQLSRKHCNATISALQSQVGRQQTVNANLGAALRAARSVRSAPTQPLSETPEVLTNEASADAVGYLNGLFGVR